MSVDRLIFWLFVAAWLVVGGTFFFVIVPRIVSEIVRIVRRILAIVDATDSSLRIAKVEADLARIEAATTAYAPLIARSEAAFAVIRASPIIPPAIGPFVTRVKAEIASLRTARRSSSRPG